MLLNAVPAELRTPDVLRAAEGLVEAGFFAFLGDTQVMKWGFPLTAKTIEKVCSSTPGQRGSWCLRLTEKGEEHVAKEKMKAWGMELPDAENAPAEGAMHSPDFRMITVGETQYPFTKTQAVIVKELYEAAQNGTPDVGDAFLLERADAKTSRLVDIFRDCAAWGTLILPGATRGTRRLNLPKS
ncbi:MAG: hypothetical protein JXB13_01920 [Phycisphaerae bacterium]|nr:hypothetical protein [Phycisphaerae bacterium]